MLKFINVTKSFKEDFWKEGKVVLNDLSFTLEEGSLCGFLGANGAGKTTSIKSLLGFISIDSGEIKFSENLGKSIDEVKAKVGYFPERPYFYAHMTGMEFCLYLGKLQGVAPKKLHENILAWSKKLKIDFALDRKINHYSKGMLQRLGFVSCLIHDPKLIILDEPLSGLDPLGRKDFKDIMVELNRSGVTVFFSSHIVSDVEEICDSLVVISEGKKVYEGKTKDLILESSQLQYKVSLQMNSSFENLKSKFSSLKLLNENSNTTQVLIEANEKDNLLQEALKSNWVIEEVSKTSPSLEQIIYRTDGSL